MNFRTRRDHYKQLFQENRGLIVAEDVLDGFFSRTIFSELAFPKQQMDILA